MGLDWDASSSGMIGGKGSDLMDEEREESLAYEYLCRLEEVRLWLLSCLGADGVPSSVSVSEFESQLRCGVSLARLAVFIAPEFVSEREIFDPLCERFGSSGLHFRHTDNINLFLRACRAVGLPEVFMPETTDIYEAKNLPRAVFCLHALSLFLFKLGVAPRMSQLLGTATFTPQEISRTRAALRELDSPLPQFRRLHREEEEEESEPLMKCTRLLPGATQRYKLRLQRMDNHTQEQAQEVVDQVNVLLHLENVIREKKVEDLRGALEPINLQVDFDPHKTEMYLDFLHHALLALDGQEELQVETVEAAMAEANRRDVHHSYAESLSRLNVALRDGDVPETTRALKHLDVPTHAFAARLYHEELAYIVSETGRDLKREAVISLIQFLNGIATLNQAVRYRNTPDTWKGLLLTNIEDLDPGRKEAYTEALHCALQSKDGELLSHFEIQDAVDAVNKSASDEAIHALQRVNEALRKGDSVALHKNLSSPALHCGRIEQRDAPHALELLRSIVANKSILEEEDSEAWLDNVLDAVATTLAHAQEASEAGLALSIVNMAVQQGDPGHTFQTLLHPSLCLGEHLHSKHQESIQVCLLERFNQKEAGGETDWVRHALSDGDSFVYLNLRDHTYSWSEPTPVHSHCQSSFLDVQDILLVLEDINRGQRQELDDTLVVALQARIRGFLTRKRLFAMLEHYYENVESVIKVQALVRGHQVRVRLGDALKRAPRTLKPLSYYLPHEEGIVRIQRAWREHKKALDLAALNKVDTEGRIDLSVVRRYLYLLDHSQEDFEQELRLQSLKGLITKTIRSNQSLEKALDVMDIKIGLLVKNRISVEEVVAHSKTLVRSTSSMRASSLNLLREEECSGKASHGLKALKKESRAKLEAYQHLFYYLQTHPVCLAKLIFAMPQLKTTKFMESVILSLYNFGANQREEYLLLKLFQTALEEEIRVKVEKPSDIITGQPLVIKMIVSFYRNGGKGSNSLRDMLGTIVRRVLEDKTLCINTSPVDIYKQWINSEEFSSGRASEMPYNVTPTEALSHEEVRKRLNRSMVKLKQATTLFLATIIRSRKKIPYGMLFMARVLYAALKKKFPETQEKEILKVVGNLLYYRFINGAIVAPDAFDIIDLSADNVLGNEQRRNLGSISKILQFAASKRGYGEESVHLMALNPYIVDCHDKFKKFFRTCVEEVPSPEEEFNMDQYSEATLIAKPVIFISLQEIVDSHQLLLDFQEAVAPDPSDPLHELLDDLGEGGPSLCSLLGVAPASRNGSLQSLGSSEVCLTLTNKFEAGGADRSDTEELFIKTKHLVLSVLPCTRESNLIGCLKSESSPEMEDRYWRLVSQKEAEEMEASRNRTMLDVTNPFINDEGRLPLPDCKRQILKNLMVLEVAGLVTSKDGCKSLIRSIIKDVLHRRQYRSRRLREIFRLKTTQQSLKVKTDFLQEQVAYYDTYLKTCLKNLQVGKRKRVHFAQPHSSSSNSSRSSASRQPWGSRIKSRSTLRYSASRLHEKGVLLTIDGLPPSQFKNVQFEIVPTEHDGVFEIHAKFMGVNLEHVEVNIQDLLQFQYEGVSVMNMFKKANINVNLLLHFLNSKYYGRKK